MAAIRVRLRVAMGPSEPRKSHELENLSLANIWTNSKPSWLRVSRFNSTSVKIPVPIGFDQREVPTTSKSHIGPGVMNTSGPLLRRHVSNAGLASPVLRKAVSASIRSDQPEILP